MCFDDVVPTVAISEQRSLVDREGELTYKSRLVSRGFREEGVLLSGSKACPPTERAPLPTVQPDFWLKSVSTTPFHKVRSSLTLLFRSVPFFCICLSFIPLTRPVNLGRRRHFPVVDLS